VRVTAAGVMGDSGMGSPSYFLFATGPTRARLLQSQCVYRRAVACGQVQRGVTRPTVSDGTFCMALNLGLDHRDLLPPFLPVQRNQDGVFAVLLRACFDNVYFGFLPWMVLHRAPASRQQAEAFLQNGARVTSGQLFEGLIGSYSAGPNRANARQCLRALGRSLEDWGTAPAADFEELLRIVLWNQTSAKAQQLSPSSTGAGPTRFLGGRRSPPISAVAGGTRRPALGRARRPGQGFWKRRVRSVPAPGPRLWPIPANLARDGDGGPRAP
jgi:hypothetical protein